MTEETPEAEEAEKQREFDRAKVIFEQDCQEFRSLNGFLWQIDYRLDFDRGPVVRRDEGRRKRFRAGVVISSRSCIERLLYRGSLEIAGGSDGTLA
jgi:hypothetical protein